jgi:hypothetical protein
MLQVQLFLAAFIDLPMLVAMSQLLLFFPPLIRYVAALGTDALGRDVDVIVGTGKWRVSLRVGFDM